MSAGVTGLIQSGCTNQRSQRIFIAVPFAEKCNEASKLPIFLDLRILNIKYQILLESSDIGRCKHSGTDFVTSSQSLCRMLRPYIKIVFLDYQPTNSG